MFDIHLSGWLSFEKRKKKTSFMDVVLIVCRLTTLGCVQSATWPFCAGGHGSAHMFIDDTVAATDFLPFQPLSSLGPATFPMGC